MANQTLSTTGCVMPSDFNVAAYEAVHQRVSANSHRNQDAWEQYAGAWNGVAYRFLACAESDIAFTTSIRQAGDTPPPLERYLQERELFNFFVTGLASIESLCFGLSAIGSMLAPAKFPMKTLNHLKNIYPKSTATRFASVFSGEPLSATLQHFTATPEFQYLNDIRNSAVVICHARATMLHLGDTEYYDTEEGVRDGTADCCPCAGGRRPRGGLSRLA
jgi:hypothetical protein